MSCSSHQGLNCQRLVIYYSFICGSEQEEINALLSLFICRVAAFSSSYIYHQYLLPIKKVLSRSSLRPFSIQHCYSIPCFNTVNSSADDLGLSVIKLVIPLMIIPTLAVGLRFWSRAIKLSPCNGITSRFWWDDWFALTDLVYNFHALQ